MKSVAQFMWLKNNKESIDRSMIYIIDYIDYNNGSSHSFEMDFFYMSHGFITETSTEEKILKRNMRMHSCFRNGYK